MLVRVYSDIHNEIRRYYKLPQWFPPELDKDKDTVLILAGDIDHAKQLPKYLDELAKRFKAVVHVAGNHEFYNSNIRSAKNRMKEYTADNVYHLDNEYIHIDGYKIIGSTLWTDLSNPIIGNTCQQQMNDYRSIRLGEGSYRNINVNDTTKWNQESVKFLKENINKDSIVVTHHNPLDVFNKPRSIINGTVSNVNPLDYAFYANQEDLLQLEPKMWISGHTHDVYDFIHKNVRMVSNCVGYPSEETETKDLFGIK